MKTMLLCSLLLSFSLLAEDAFVPVGPIAPDLNLGPHYRPRVSHVIPKARRPQSMSALKTIQNDNRQFLPSNWTPQEMGLCTVLSMLLDPKLNLTVEKFELGQVETRRRSAYGEKVLDEQRKLRGVGAIADRISTGPLTDRQYAPFFGEYSREDDYSRYVREYGYPGELFELHLLDYKELVEFLTTAANKKGENQTLQISEALILLTRRYDGDLLKASNRLAAFTFNEVNIARHKEGDRGNRANVPLTRTMRPLPEKTDDPMGSIYHSLGYSSQLLIFGHSARVRMTASTNIHEGIYQGDMQDLEADHMGMDFADGILDALEKLKEYDRSAVDIKSEKLRRLNELYCKDADFLAK